jgi:hypothetical protein
MFCHINNIYLILIILYDTVGLSMTITVTHITLFLLIPVSHTVRFSMFAIFFCGHGASARPYPTCLVRSTVGEIVRSTPAQCRTPADGGMVRELGEQDLYGSCCSGWSDAQSAALLRQLS